MPWHSNDSDRQNALIEPVEGFTVASVSRWHRSSESENIANMLASFG